MEIGGAERSLIGLLNTFDTNSYEIDLFIHNHQGEFMPLIPKTVNLLKEEPKYTTLERPIIDIVKEGFWDIAFGRLCAKLAFKFHMTLNRKTEGSAIFQYVADYTTSFLPSLKKYGYYDLAISFLAPHNIVLEKVDAKKKIAWIHTDYSTIQIDIDREIKIWKRYDYIASISESVTETFLKKFGKLRDKIILIENILSPSFIQKQAKLLDVSEEMKVEESFVRICSIGRFCKAKNFANIPWICKHMVELGIKIKWFLLGYGDDSTITQQIKKANMEKYVTILGKRINPYPYIKECDIYAQPSLYEGKAVTVREAQILYKPVVITNFPTACSQLKNGIDGIIVPLENKLCANGIVEFILDKEKQNRIINYLHSHNYGNEKEVEKIEQLV
ncbi:MAG: glycosyltransferase [Bacteroides sp.]|nr:glycosyltransferase [Bacteroides sp.]